MNKKIKGFIIGKFYPPHLGHHFLIDIALENCDELYLILCQYPKMSIPGGIRKSWLEKIHPKIKKIILVNINFDVTNPKLWVDKTVEWLGFTPDIVFSSESYADKYTEILGIKHQKIDPQREKFPISGELIRENLAKYQHYLHPLVKKSLKKLI